MKAVRDGFGLPRLIFILFPIIQRLRTERDSLKETIEELRCVQAQEGQLTTTGKGRIRRLNASFLKSVHKFSVEYWVCFCLAQNKFKLF